MLVYPLTKFKVQIYYQKTLNLLKKELAWNFINAQWTKFHLYTFFPSQNITSNMLLSSYFDS